jgi:tRNA-splicing ligase RtcB
MKGKIMIQKKDLKKIEEYLYEIPKSFRQDMRVPARIYADEKLLESIWKDRSLEQLVNVATLPGIVGYAFSMPDVHEGYGFPIGGVAATKLPHGVISPGGVGYDINCGTRVLTSEVSYNELKPYLEKLLDELFYHIPSGVGKKGEIKLTLSQMDHVLQKGSKWAVQNGYGTKEDLQHTEEQGCMPGANATYISERAKQRGIDQLGTLGSGNHFLEIGVIEEIFDEKIATKFNLQKNQITIFIHSGSRGLGHQVCTDYVREMHQKLPSYGIKLPDPELACAPLDSEEGKKYFGAMAASANFAWANRQCLSYLVTRVWEKSLGNKIKDLQLKLLYDVAHNIAKVERHELYTNKQRESNTNKVELCVHRKGATRAFGPNHPVLSEDYKPCGQPVLIPGNMGTASYILIGTDKAMRTTFGSVCHGAGRVLSRKATKRKIWGEKLEQDLRKKGIIVKCKSKSGLAEEAPCAYKDIDMVVDILQKAGLAKKIAKLIPIGVIKG